LSGSGPDALFGANRRPGVAPFYPLPPVLGKGASGRLCQRYSKRRFCNQARPPGDERYLVARVCARRDQLRVAYPAGRAAPRPSTNCQAARNGAAGLRRLPMPERHAMLMHRNKPGRDGQRTFRALAR